MFNLKLIFLLSNCWFVLFCQVLDLHFRTLKLTLNEDWIITEIQTVDEISCLAKCDRSFICAFVKYNTNKCKIYSEDARTNLSTSEISYEKIQTSLTKCNFDEYWSFKNLQCLSCPFGFLKLIQIPSACFTVNSTNRPFNQAKSFCTLLGAHLPRTKSRLERTVLSSRFPSKSFWIDSSITQLGEIYKWHDGTLVTGFAQTEPNNLGQNSLNENSLCLYNGYINDISENFSLLTVCQYD